MMTHSSARHLDARKAVKYLTYRHLAYGQMDKQHFGQHFGVGLNGHMVVGLG